MPEQRMAPLALVAPGKPYQASRHSHPCQHRRECRTGHAHRRHAQPAVDEHPVEEPVHQVGQHKRDGNNPHLSNALQIPSRRAVKQQRQRAQHQDPQIFARRPGHLRRDAHMREPVADRKQQYHQRHAGDAGQVHALRQPVVARIVVAAAVGLRHQRVQPQHQPDAEQRRRVEHGIAHGHGTNRRRPQLAHHDGVHHALQHPAQLAENDRNRQRDHRTQFVPPIGLGQTHLPMIRS